MCMFLMSHDKVVTEKGSLFLWKNPKLWNRVTNVETEWWNTGTANISLLEKGLHHYHTRKECLHLNKNIFNHHWMLSHRFCALIRFHPTNFLYSRSYNTWLQKLFSNLLAPYDCTAVNIFYCDLPSTFIWQCQSSFDNARDVS